MNDKSVSVEVVVDELESHRIDWESHGWEADNQSVMTASSTDKFLIEDSKKKAVAVKRETWAEVKDRLDLSFLTSDQEEISEWIAAFWYIHFPIDAYTSKRIVQLAMRLPKENVEPLVYPFVPIVGSKKKFFGVLCDYGKSYGLSIVGNKLFNGASAGDPRAVKMYLELMSVLEETKENNKGVLLEFII